MNNTIVKDITTDLERAFYASNKKTFINCTIDGPLDGESAFKESKDIIVSNCNFVLRYPFWHNTNLTIQDSIQQETCRAAIWYSKNILINNSKLYGIKVLRECKNTNIKDSNIISEYPFFKSSNLNLENVHLTGKYSFQYCENVVINNSYLDTKDAFWETKNVTVYNSTIKGEYLAWYSKDLHLINCTIIGTQPLCYCKGLVLENCKMIDCDLSFEYSEVNAQIIGKIDSIKNPLKGEIIYDECGEIIEDENFKNEGIIIKKNNN